MVALEEEEVLLNLPKVKILRDSSWTSNEEEA
jgi:hypothetical protein